VGKCFRNEDHYVGLERLLCFSLREIVCIGEEENVRSFLTKSKQRILDFAAAINIPLEAKIASDPFYDSEGMRAKMQMRFPVKEELVYKELSLASVKFHLRFFGERCNIRTVDENVAFSGCLGMGIERWVSVLMDIFAGDVEVIQDYLRAYLKQYTNGEDTPSILTDKEIENKQ
jgi:hypothetical protein